MSLKYFLDLQLFAEGEKTEKATPKKRKETREKGQVLQSREINSALLLIAIFLGLKVFGYYMYDNLGQFTSIVLSDYTKYTDVFTIKEMNIFIMKMISITVKIVAPIVTITFIIGLASSYLQVGFLFTTKTLQVKFSKINPIEGFKRIFSFKSLIELVKAFIKIFLIGYIVYKYAVGEMKNIFKLYDFDIPNIVKYIGTISFGIAMRAGGVLIGLAILDYAYQWWEHQKNLKMSKQEIKEEYKQSEGDPQLKSKIKEKQRQIAMRRMMQDVPKADVIITNPTHFAVAIKYDKDGYDAPFVLAKGKDLIAQNIKKLAKDFSVPIVENKPLAQSIYKMVDIGGIIPGELYQAVAEVLAYVYSLNEY